MADMRPRATARLGGSGCQAGSPLLRRQPHPAPTGLRFSQPGTEGEEVDPFNQSAPSQSQPDPNLQSLLEMARAALERDDVGEAQSRLSAALEIASEHWEIYHLSGILQAKARAWEAAIAYFKKAHELHPTHPAPLTNLGNVCTEREQYEEAIAWYERALHADPDYANAHHNLAVAFRRVGRLAESVRHLKKAQRLELTVQRPQRTRSRAGSGRHAMLGWFTVLVALAMLVAWAWLF